MKFLKKKKLLIVFPLIVFFFLLGSWSERYEYDKKISKSISNFIETITSNLQFTLSKKDKIIIDIKFSDYEKLGVSRLNMINNLKASSDMQIKVPAKIYFNDSKINDAKISIKGTHSDHWEKDKKWSFKVNLPSGKMIFGANEFALQHPATRGFIYEWLFMKFLEYEDLISHKVEFLEVIINGENLGIYNFTEAHAQELLKSNKKSNGPIVFYNKLHWIKETSKLNDLGVNDYKNSFYKAPISVANKSEWLKDPNKKKQLNQAVYLLESFRNQDLSVGEVFDVKQIAKIFAIKAIFGAVEFDWKDIKFYFNPETSLLEPIGREVHVDLNQIDHEPKTWWLEINPNNFSHSKDQGEFLKLFYSDLDFYELYLKELNRIANLDYYDKVIKININEFNRFKSILNKFFPHINTYSYEKIKSQIKFIQDTLSPVREINAYFLKEKEGFISLNIENLQKLPLRLLKLELGDNTVSLEKNKIIKAFSLEKKNSNIVKFKCNLEIKCFNLKNKNQTIIYEILGQKIIRKEKILPWSNIKF